MTTPDNLPPPINPDWLTHPISCICLVLVSPEHFCEKPTVAAYPTMGGGWQSLCNEHAAKHLPCGAYLTDDLIEKGGRWE